MAGGTWYRTNGSTQLTTTTTATLGTVNVGQTLLRTHFGAACLVRTDAETDPNLIFPLRLAWGICTVLATGGTTPNALTGNSDVAPPLQRWLWWTAAFFTPYSGSGAPYSGYGAYAAFTAPNPVDIEAMVAAPTNAVNVKMAVAIAGPLPTDAIFTVTHWSSCLIR